MFPNPAISGRAIINALDPETASAGHLEARAEQSALDEADLREVERAEFYDQRPAVPERNVPAPRKRLLDRLLRR